MSEISPTQPRRHADVAQWDHETAVAIVGFGGAGACAAIEAADAGAEVTLFEVASAGGGWAGADFNGDASIDLADFNIWLTTVPPDAPLLNAVPVPEPTTMALFGLVGLLAAGRRRRIARTKP